MEQIIERLPVIVNGREKFATGLTRLTTIDDLKYAMLSVCDASFNVSMLDDYAMIEKWQGNERMLDGRIKIHKLIRLWKSVPGNQLPHVQFIIKRKAAKRRAAAHEHRPYAFCTLSPELTKTWNVEKCKRSVSKSSYVRKQLDLLASQISDEKKKANGDELNRYASIKKLNKSKKCTIKKTANESELKQDLIDLVKQQNEIIERQLSTMKAMQTPKSKAVSLSVKLAHSLKKTGKKLVSGQSHENASLEKELNKTDDITSLKTKFIQSLENELRILDEMNSFDGECDNEDGGDDEERMLIENVYKKSSLLSKFASKSSILSSESGISSTNSDDLIQFETLV